MSILGGGDGTGGGGPNIPTAPATPASMLATMAQQLGLSMNPGGGVVPPSTSAPPIPGKDAGLKPTSTTASSSGGNYDPNLAKNIGTLLQNPALLKTLVPQASAIQGGNRGMIPPGPDGGAGKPNFHNQFGGGMGMQQGKPGGGTPSGDSEMGNIQGARPPQPPPMPGARGVPGSGY